MRFYFNTANGALGTSLNDGSGDASGAVKRGDTEPVEVVFHKNGVLLDLDPVASAETLKFGVKVPTFEDGSYVFAATSGWVKSNGTVFTDCGTTSASAIITSATAVFNEGDVGLSITGDGIPAGSTIIAIGDATHATISAAATLTSGGSPITLTIIGRETVYTASPSFNTTKGNNLLGYDPDGFAEVTEIRTVAGNATGVGFKLYDNAGSVGVWIDLDNGGTTIPSQASACARAIEITTIATGDSAPTKATKIAAALTSDGKWVATASGDVVSIIDASIGTRTSAADFTGNQATTFSFLRWIAGSAPNTMANVLVYPLEAEITYTALGNTKSSQTFELDLIFRLNNGGESDPIPSYGSQWNRTAISNGATYVDVTFATAFGTAPLLLGPTVVKASNSDDNIFASGAVIPTTTGFRVYLSGATPNGNYKLDWFAYPL